jgi:hypothetical protein
LISRTIHWKLAPDDPVIVSRFEFWESQMPTSPTAAQVLDGYFPEVRAKLLEIAASLDRVHRAEDFETVSTDRRLAQICEAIEELNKDGTNRAEQIQLIFSDEYDPNWER